MLVAGPMMVLSGAALESIKGLSFSKYMELHDVLVRGMAWVGVMMCIPLFIGMLGSRWFLHFPCDFIMAFHLIPFDHNAYLFSSPPPLSTHSHSFPMCQQLQWPRHMWRFR